MIRTRLSMTAVAFLVGAITSACGGGGAGAPSDASTSDFCDSQSSLLEDLVFDALGKPKVPTEEEMAKVVKSWGAKLEEVGTPEDIPDDARKGFEAVVQQATEIDPSDFSVEKLEQLEGGGEDASAEASKQATAFSDYLIDTCGNPMDDIEMPAIPELPGSTE